MISLAIFNICVDANIVKVDNHRNIVYRVYHAVPELKCYVTEANRLVRIITLILLILDITNECGSYMSIINQSMSLNREY